MRSWPAEMLRWRSSLMWALRGRLVAGSGLPASSSEVVDAFDAGSVLASEAVEVLAVRLSSSLWNLRFVVASAGGASAEAMMRI